jgi:hypothetical protein
LLEASASVSVVEKSKVDDAKEAEGATALDRVAKSGECGTKPAVVAIADSSAAPVNFMVLSRYKK